MKLTKNTLIEGTILKAGTQVIIQEKKDHLIKKMYQLTPEQQDELITYFNNHPNLENKLDWNKAKQYSWDEIVKQVGLYTDSKTAKKKKVKQKGIRGLVEGTDFYEIDLPNSSNPNLIVNAYIPLSYEVSKLIASDRVGGCEGQWCTAYQKTDQYWKEYTGKGIVLIYIVIQNTETNENKKYAIAYSIEDVRTENFDMEDHKVSDMKIEEETGIKFYEFLDSPYIIKAREELFTPNTHDDILEVLMGGRDELENFTDPGSGVYILDAYGDIDGNTFMFPIDENFFGSNNKFLADYVFTTVPKEIIETGSHVYTDEESLIWFLTQEFPGYLRTSISRVMSNYLPDDITFNFEKNDFNEEELSKKIEDNYPELMEDFGNLYREAYGLAYNQVFVETAGKEMERYLLENGVIDTTEDIVHSEDQWTTQISHGFIIKATEDAKAKDNNAIDILDYAQDNLKPNIDFSTIASKINYLTEDEIMYNIQGAISNLDLG